MNIFCKWYQRFYLISEAPLWYTLGTEYWLKNLCPTRAGEKSYGKQARAPVELVELEMLATGQPFKGAHTSIPG